VSGRSYIWLGVLVAAAATQARAQEPTPPPSISDNSFLMEEAYNQEPGVVQHISAFQLFRGADSWAYSFTQEWPLFSRTHQLSFTVPIQRIRNGSSFATGLGDVGVNYRYQLVAGERLSVSPRLSLLLPTGRAKSELGAGALGVQVNMPASVVVASKVVTHWNAGSTRKTRKPLSQARVWSSISMHRAVTVYGSTPTCTAATKCHRTTIRWSAS